MSVRRALDRVGGGEVPAQMDPVRVDQEHGLAGRVSVTGGAIGATGEIVELTLPEAAAATGLGAAAGPGLILLGGAVESVGAAWEVIEAHESGALQSFMNSAFGETGGDPTTEARRLGARAVLVGSSDASIAAMERELAARPGGRTLVQAFRAGAAQMETLREGRPEQFQEARTRARELLQDARAGVAAALEGGWSRGAVAGRSPVFQRAFERASATLATDPARFAALRREAVATRRTGFRDSTAGRVDARRYETDPSYRHGVDHHRRMEHEHPEQVAPTLRRLGHEQQVERGRARPSPA